MAEFGAVEFTNTLAEPTARSRLQESSLIQFSNQTYKHMNGTEQQEEGLLLHAGSLTIPLGRKKRERGREGESESSTPIKTAMKWKRRANSRSYSYQLMHVY